MLAGTALRHQMVLPEQRRIYDYWRSKCRAGRIPSRSDINPAEIREHLPMISMVEACTDSGHQRYKYRLAGTGFWDLFEDEITGRYVDELPIGDRTNYWQRVFDRIMSSRRPSVGVTRPGTPVRSYMAQFWVRLPLSDDGETVNCILGFDHLVKNPAALLQPAQTEKVPA